MCPSEKAEGKPLQPEANVNGAQTCVGVVLFCVVVCVGWTTWTTPAIDFVGEPGALSGPTAVKIGVVPPNGGGFSREELPVGRVSGWLYEVRLRVSYSLRPCVLESRSFNSSWNDIASHLTPGG